MTFQNSYRVALICSVEPRPRIVAFEALQVCPLSLAPFWTHIQKNEYEDYFYYLQIQYAGNGVSTGQ